MPGAVVAESGDASFWDVPLCPLKEYRISEQSDLSGLVWSIYVEVLWKNMKCSGVGLVQIYSKGVAPRLLWCS